MRLRRSFSGREAIGSIRSATLPASRYALRALLVGTGPVEDLLLDELAGRQGLERRAGEGEVEIGACRDWQEVLLIAAKLVELLVEDGTICIPGANSSARMRRASTPANRKNRNDVIRYK